MARIGDPPIGKPMQLAIWYQNAITVLTGELLKGKDVGKLLESVRASSGAVARAMPLNVIHAAGVRLDEDEREMNDDVGAAGTVERKDDHVAQQHARAVRRDPS